MAPGVRPLEPGSDIYRRPASHPPRKSSKVQKQTGKEEVNKIMAEEEKLTFGKADDGFEGNQLMSFTKEITKRERKRKDTTSCHGIQNEMLKCAGEDSSIINHLIFDIQNRYRSLLESSPDGLREFGDVSGFLAT